ncbi:hypothetical protein SDC9_04179 [bioreactor metagenome]|uniref:BRCT domain-containing protein n=1 Tax=bioreactor metagenome TaxID=1076179 RepID=A0A644SVI9_9ZZZZ|nr:BRCT domain-containing protein [Negativicutes bacterium]
MMRCPDCGFESTGEICTNCCSTSHFPTTKIKELDMSTTKQAILYDSGNYSFYNSKAKIDKTINFLRGILAGIIIDRQLNATEVDKLKEWYESNKQQINRHPFSELIPTIEIILKGSTITRDDIDDILWLCDQFTGKIFYDLITSDIQKLHGIMRGILADDRITDKEIQGLRVWINDNDHLTATYPYDELCSLVTAVLSDGTVTSDERELLIAFFIEFTGYNSEIKTKSSLSKKTISKQGICSVCPEIVLPDKQYCFTGISSKTSREGFANIVSSLGGIYKNSVSSKTDYLVVGNECNPCWAFACYGRKVEAAVNLRKSGNRILIVHEYDFWDYYNDFVAGL